MKQSYWMAACVLLLLSSCKKQQTMPADNRYPMMTVTRSDKTLETSYSATMEGEQDVNVYPQVTGKITKICVSEGATVRKGETLFVIDQVAYRSALATARANVESAQAGVANARLTLESKRKLRDQKVISSYEYEQAEIALRTQQAALAQSHAEYTKARNELSYTEVKSPVSGVAGMTSYRVGALVSASMTSPLITVSDDRTMRVYFSLTESQMLEMTRHTGNKPAFSSLPQVTLTLSDGSTYGTKGRIDAISGIVDKETGTVRVRACFANPNHLLRSGNTGNILLPTLHRSCIVIPQAATYELQDKVFVYKVVNGKARSTRITVYPLNDGRDYIVESGLSTGDVIITDGAGLLQDGTEVKAQKTK